MVLVPIELTPAVQRFLLGALVGEARRWRVCGRYSPARRGPRAHWVGSRRVTRGQNLAWRARTVILNSWTENSQQCEVGASESRIKRAVASGVLAASSVRSAVVDRRD